MEVFGVCGVRGGLGGEGWPWCHVSFMRHGPDLGKGAGGEKIIGGGEKGGDAQHQN